MCKRHSFIVTRAGKVHDGFGITDSHTTIREFAGLHANNDTVNAYEWQPPEGWPESDWEDGLTKDNEVFELKSSHLSAMKRHIKKLYPDIETWDKGNVPYGTLPTTVTGSLNVSGCDLKGVTLPTTVGSLDARGCDLKGVTLPTTVGSLYVRGCDLKGVTLPKCKIYK